MATSNAGQGPNASSHARAKTLIATIGDFLPDRFAKIRLIGKSIVRSEGTQLPTPWCTEYRSDKRTPPSSARQHMRRSLASLCLLLACGVLIGVRTTNAQQPQPLENREYDIKAGYFAYFGQLIQWPNPPFAEARTQFVIGVLGSNPFGRHLQATPTGFAINTEKIKTQKIQGKRIKVVEYKSVNDFQNNYSACHVLFISRSSAPGVQAETIQDRVNAALKKTKGQPVLLVAEATNMGASERLAQSGVMISYWNDRGANHVRMIINRAAEKRERLTISSRLLRLSIVSLL
jgi:hypothetical protein